MVKKIALIAMILCTNVFYGMGIDSTGLEKRLADLYALFKPTVDAFEKQQKELETAMPSYDSESTKSPEEIFSQQMEITEELSKIVEHKYYLRVAILNKERELRTQFIAPVVKAFCQGKRLDLCQINNL